MSGDPEQEYFSDGISEDIITDLSKIAGLTVIARNSSFTYKGRSVDIRTVGRELGVQSVLEGSIRRAGNRVRITAQLIDATNGGAPVGRPLRPRLDRYLRGSGRRHAPHRRSAQESRSARPKRRGSPTARHPTSLPTIAFFAAASSCLAREKNRERSNRRSKYFKKALEHDPNYSLAYACLGFGYMFDYQNRWSEDPDNSLTIAKRIRATKRSRKTRTNRWRVRRCLGGVLRKGSRSREGEEVEKAIKLNPSLALAHNLLGTIRTFSGQPLEAIPEIEQAMRIDPALSGQFLHFLGWLICSAEV